MDPVLIKPPSQRIAWSDLEPPTGPRQNLLKTGDLVRKVLVSTAPPSSLDKDLLELEAVVSGEATRDSYGDLTFADGWDFERWLKNPVVTWAHRYGEPPIGTGLWIKVEKPNLVSRMRFWNGDGEWGDFAREIFSMYANDPPFMRAFSVGFMPTKWNAVYDETANGGRVFVGYDFLEKELWEYACVTIPAYPDALAKAAQSSAFPRLAKILKHPSIAGPVPRAESPARPEELAELRTALTNLWAQTAAGNLKAALRKQHHASHP